MKFENYPISEDIKRSLATLGFIKPTDIQFRAIPSIIRGEDVLAIAQTGTGKTAAFAIPIINRLHERKSSKRADDIKCIVLAPTRELAMQIASVFSKLGQHTTVKTFCLTGGVEHDPQINKMEKGFDILVATPGRMFEMVSLGHLKIDRIEILVLDEADRMLDMGFIRDIRDLLKFIPRRRQTLFFSATINEEIKDLAYSLVVNPIRIQISPKDKVSKNIDHAVVFVEMDDKRFFLERIVNEHPQSKILVFVRTKVRAERVLSAMQRVGIAAQTIHGDKLQKNRSAVMRDFSEGVLKVLIATDVSARGIDVPSVEYVINYDLPDIAENYVHRVGRTGRGTKRGIAISFCSTEEKKILEEIEQFLTQEIKVMPVDNLDYNAIVDMSEDSEKDWHKLIEEQEKYDAKKKKKKKK